MIKANRGNANYLIEREKDTEKKGKPFTSYLANTEHRETQCRSKLEISVFEDPSP
jgi:hypothetical protein